MGGESAWQSFVAPLRGDGSILLVQTANRLAAEWELMAREILGKALHVQLPPLPDAYELSEM
ncbi:hypothetical protein [Streptomyces sp. NPDC046862]|uniref:hypothetical protein n=1 Tax=Streptomyces sp. NPDC046862 TaxID=3154603 RepID=UPI003455FF43